MTLINSTALKSVKIDAERQYYAGGSLELLSAGGAVLVSIPLAANAGSVTGDTWTLAFASAGVGAAAAGAGVAAATGRLKNSAGVVGSTGFVVRTTGTTPPADESTIFLDNVSIAQNQSVTVTSGVVVEG